jgi:hypothetical protein
MTIPMPERHIFRPGEAVLFISSTVRWSKPLAGVPAVVLQPYYNHSARIAQVNGKVATVDNGRLAYRGYCAACVQPAHDRYGELVCPQCDQLALYAPPPDEIVIRWYGYGAETPMAAYRAAMDPSLTWRQAVEAAQAAIKVLDENVPATMQRLNLPIIRPRYESGVRDDEINNRMRFYAALGDDAAFVVAYRELEAELGKPIPLTPNQRLLAFLKELRAALTEDDEDSTGLRVAPKWQPPADDQEPDRPDAMTAWLERQMRRAA